MAQTGYTPIQHYYSITGGNTPTTGNLTLGEIAINVADQKVYMLNSASNAVVTLVGTLGNQNANSVSITGGSINGTTIGASTASTGAFTTISASGVITSTVSTGTAPFTVASTTQVANLNAATAGTATNATTTAITDNTSSSATWYPTIVSATTGNLPQTTSSTKLSFVPSTGTLTATNYAGAWAGSTIGTGYGGTGLTSFTANGVVYASSSSVLATSSAFTFNGTDVAFTGNLIPGTASKGINFTANTPASGMTSQLLNWYETGTWTPSVGGNATYYAQVGKYTRIGNIVRISGSLVINVLGTGSATTISGLPFASTGSPADFVGFSNFSSLALTVVYIAGSANGSSQIDIRSLLVAGTGVASNNVLGNGTRVDFAGTYSV